MPPMVKTLSPSQLPSAPTDIGVGIVQGEFKRPPMSPRVEGIQHGQDGKAYAGLRIPQTRINPVGPMLLVKPCQRSHGRRPNGPVLGFKQWYDHLGVTLFTGSNQAQRFDHYARGVILQKCDTPFKEIGILQPLEQTESSNTILRPFVLQQFQRHFLTRIRGNLLNLVGTHVNRRNALPKSLPFCRGYRIIAGKQLRKGLTGVFTELLVADAAAGTMYPAPVANTDSGPLVAARVFECGPRFPSAAKMQTTRSK